MKTMYIAIFVIACMFLCGPLVQSAEAQQSAPFQVDTWKFDKEGFSDQIKVTHDLEHFWQPIPEYFGDYFATGGDRGKDPSANLRLDRDGTGVLTIRKAAGPFERPSILKGEINFKWGIILDDNMKAFETPGSKAWGFQYVVALRREKFGDGYDDWSDEAWLMGTKDGKYFLAEGSWQHR
jgi:hypothetical protein